MTINNDKLGVFFGVCVCGRVPHVQTNTHVFVHIIFIYIYIYNHIQYTETGIPIFSPGPDTIDTRTIIRFDFLVLFIVCNNFL